MPTPPSHPSNDSQDAIRILLTAKESMSDALAMAKYLYLMREAERKHVEATLIKESQGSSQAEKLVNAQATSQWVGFHKELAELEARYHWHVLKLDVIQSQLQIEYLLLKQAYELIGEQV